jgi:uncharacterized membrane protein
MKPRSGPLFNRLIFVLSLAGAGVTFFLTVAHANNVIVPCGPSHGCESVAAHPSSHGFGIPALSGIPTAAFGLAMYAALAIVSFARAVFPSEKMQRAGGWLQWLMGLSGVAVSGWLTYLEAYVIHAWCRWCVASAIIITLVFITASIERIAQARSAPAPA